MQRYGLSSTGVIHKVYGSKSICGAARIRREIPVEEVDRSTHDQRCARCFGRAA
jgi:hypothetical protein